MNQGEAISVFTLMILEIAIQKNKISSISKTTDMSDRSGSGNESIRLLFIKARHKFKNIVFSDIKRTNFFWGFLLLCDFIRNICDILIIIRLTNFFI